MLHLQPGVHFEEVVVAVGIDNELDRPGGEVIDGPRQVDGGPAHFGAHFLIDERARRLFQDLLVAPLDGAFPLTQIDHVPMGVGEHLDFNMARLEDQLFEKHPSIAEARFRFRRTSAKGLVQFGSLHHLANSLAAAAGRGLEHHRVSDVLGEPRRLRRIGNGIGVARNRRHAGGLGQLLGFNLVAERADGRGRRADERHLLGRQTLREGGVLGEESVSRVNRLGARLLDSRHDRIDIEIALQRRRGTDQHGVAGHIHMEGVPVGFRIDGDGSDAHGAG